jgi:putative transposase
MPDTTSSTQKPFYKGYKFRLYPTKEQKVLLSKYFGSSRFIYNRLLAENKEAYEAYKKALSENPLSPPVKPGTAPFTLVKRVTQIRHDPELSWLLEMSSDILQQSAMCLGRAFANFFQGRAKYPKFKKKHGPQSVILTTSALRFKDGKYYMPKSKEPLDILFSRDLPSTPTSAVISKTASGEYYISFICKYVPEKTTGAGVIGIDLGLKDLAVLSDGTKIPNNRYTKRYECKLRRLQQSHSRKKKGSKNREKSRIRLAKLHDRITRSRTDHLHKLSTQLIKENQVIGVEGLVVKNMVKNHSLAKHIQDVSWSTFFNMLTYKAIQSQHCTLVVMDTFYPSSHICHVTGKQLERKLSLQERSWLCPHCGATHDRDINAAKNIAREAVIAVEEMLGNPDRKRSYVIDGARYWRSREPIRTQMREQLGRQTPPRTNTHPAGQSGSVC